MNNNILPPFCAQKKTGVFINYFPTTLGVYLYSSYESANYFAIGNGPILFNTLNCAGTESTLTKCSSAYNPVYCSHNSDIGVKCDEIAGEGKVYYNMR